MNCPASVRGEAGKRAGTLLECFSGDFTSQFSYLAAKGLVPFGTYPTCATFPL